MHSLEQALEIVDGVLEHYHQPVMVEEYIGGEEVTVGIIGNLQPKILGIMRFVPKNEDEHFIYSLEVKRDWENLVDYECPAQLEKNTLDRLTQSSLLPFRFWGAGTLPGWTSGLTRRVCPTFLR